MQSDNELFESLRRLQLMELCVEVLKVIIEYKFHLIVLCSGKVHVFSFQALFCFLF